MLTQWEKELLALDHRQTIYLPFDFADEYTGLLKIVGWRHDLIDVQYGETASYQGLHPSVWPAIELADEAFRPFAGRSLMPKELLLEDIQREKAKYSESRV
ncbi:hypothetical protein [Larkinella soli]|uniref:hypothetical protein n=1 Tax=Larkinella soli TaxID=1770527 RepID=UPI000FFBEB51|nr:hypothetical protein [Larkinella soli]